MSVKKKISSSIEDKRKFQTHRIEHFDKHHALTSSYGMHLRIKRDQLWISVHIEQTVTGRKVTAHDLNASDSGCMFHPGNTCDLFLLVASSPWQFLYIIIICKYAMNW